jgi:acyl carrier protein
MSEHASQDRASIEQRLKLMLAEASPLRAEDIDGSLKLVELGMSSLQLQLLAAQVEAAFDIRFGDEELGEIETFEQLVDSVDRHRRQGQPR